ncbi:proliferating cell nuclear antigen [Acanthamoeba castellanii medusavirus]|uniref:Proliferating cell nuclear antigen n=1 Tax=Acanthamoeba castellanii medusavirus J1 TaxID=3114988 RepID=A0A3T1CXJ9_9VIRU|nr:proliferating cell nuclear antigen [Acanthamoeba castellanii medusavirus]BBI30554.1 proliferating cell nuclear antigen [Acanthamoeba castellanii medusavirus J1]
MEQPPVTKKRSRSSAKETKKGAGVAKKAKKSRPAPSKRHRAAARIRRKSDAAVHVPTPAADLVLSVDPPFALTTERRPTSEKISKYLVYMETTQLTKMRAIFDALKDMVHEINLKFFPEAHPAHGMTTMAMDSSRTSLVHMECPSRRIKESGAFHCKRDTCAGINVAYFHRIIKTLKSHDSMAIYIPDDSKGVLKIRAYQSGSNALQTYKITLLDLDDDIIEIPEIEFDCIRSINAELFQNTVHYVVQGVDPKRIGVMRDTNQRLLITGQGNYSTAKMSLDETQAGPVAGSASSSNSTEKPAATESICNYYPVRHINTAIKPYQVCEDLRLYLKTDWALIIEYPLAGLGSLRFCVAPKGDDADEEQRVNHYGGGGEGGLLDGKPPAILNQEIVMEHQAETAHLEDDEGDDDDAWSADDEPEDDGEDEDDMY